MNKIMYYDATASCALDERLLHRNVKEWYNQSLYQASVAINHAFPVLCKMEQLLAENCITIPELCVKDETSFCNGETRSLMGHLHILKKLLPSYKAACDKINFHSCNRDTNGLQ